MAKQYIQIYFSYLDAIELLSDAERGRLFTALLEYGKTGTMQGLGGNERFIFPMMRAQIDRDNEAYDDKCRKNSENRQRALTDVDENNDRQQPSTNATKEKEKEKKKNKEKDNEKDIPPYPPFRGMMGAISNP